jgi:pyrimidine-nucleoside phosphorylase
MGLAVGKVSGRGLGYSGGTLDKMESIPGYRVDLTSDEFLSQLRATGLVLSGQSVDLAPADGKLYSLRDVTGTVPSIPLIASSVMCKKLAGGAQVIALDIKCGVGAFTPNVEEAARLARLMVRIGSMAGRAMAAVIADMNQPLGHAVGNALEVAEAIETLRGGGPADFREHCLHVAGHLLLRAGRAGSLRQAKLEAARALASGAALGKLRALVEAQGGDVGYVDEPERLPRAKVVREVSSPTAGCVKWIDAREVGVTVIMLGGGRAKKGDPIDHSVGIVVHKKVGDRVAKGEKLFTVHAATPEGADLAEARVLAAHRFSRSPVEPLPLFYRTIRG